MTREEFYRITQQRLQERLPDEYSAYSVELVDVNNASGSYKGLVIVSPFDKKPVVPPLNLDVVYDDFHRSPGAHTEDEYLRFLDKTFSSALQKSQEHINALKGNENLMTRESFYEITEAWIIGMLPEEYADYQTQLVDAQNQYGSYKGLIISKPGAGVSITPRFNLDLFYDDFGSEEPLKALEDVASAIRPVLDEARRLSSDVGMKFADEMLNYDHIKGNLYVAVMSLERQKNLQDTLYHVEEGMYLQVRVDFPDLPVPANASGSSEVTQAMLDAWKMDFDQVYQDALENTARLYPPEICRIEDILSDLMGKDFIPPKQSSLYVITNEEHSLGAATIFLPGVQERVANELGDSYIVIPSSIHEVLALPLYAADSGAMTEENIKTFTTMIHDVNEGVVGKNEWMAEEPYFYDKRTGKFQKAADALKESPEHQLISERIRETPDFQKDVNPPQPGL